MAYFAARCAAATTWYTNSAVRICAAPTHLILNRNRAHAERTAISNTSHTRHILLSRHVEFVFIHPSMDSCGGARRCIRGLNHASRETTRTPCTGTPHLRAQNSLRLFLHHQHPRALRNGCASGAAQAARGGGRTCSSNSSFRFKMSRLAAAAFVLWNSRICD